MEKALFAIEGGEDDGELQLLELEGPEDVFRHRLEMRRLGLRARLVGYVR